jgi:hypothetical protein|tara:strand:+ start:537 stop:815 length:279 start_codon:yes stop_codon:yes gene_type:complete
VNLVATEIGRELNACNDFKAQIECGSSCRRNATYDVMIGDGESIKTGAFCFSNQATWAQNTVRVGGMRVELGLSRIRDTPPSRFVNNVLRRL